MNESESVAETPDSDFLFAPLEAEPPPMPPPAAPVQETARVHSLDVLRGVAVLGILYMNVQSFSMPDPAYSTPVAWGDFSGANYYVWLAGRLFADQKFMTIFSMLFGAGIVLMSERLKASDRSPGRVHYRRMTVLLGFGLLHAYGVWSGDILFHYAACGMIVYPFRKLPPGVLLGLAFLVLLAGSAIFGLVWLGIAASNADTEMKWNTAESIAMTLNQVDAYQGAWHEELAQRVEESLSMHFVAFPFFMVWRVTAVMLLGMALYRWGMFDARLSSTRYARVGATCAAIGVSTEWLGIRHMVARDWGYAAVEIEGMLFNYWASLFTAVGWVCLVMIAYRFANERSIAPPQSLLGAAFCGPAYRFAAVGRMAFTNYIAQSVICTTIFYGHGLGMYGEVARVEQVAIVAGLWVAQLVWSPLWLFYFRMGPLEWLWRVLTYGRWQGIRRVEI